VQARRHEDALAALLVGQGRHDLAERDAIGTQEMCGLVGPFERRRERDRQRSK